MSAGLLLYELCLTRILSVLFYYHTAFLAISVAMLGLGAGGVWVYLRPTTGRGRAGALAVFASVGMCLLPAAFPLLQPDAGDVDRLFDAGHLVALTLTVLITVVPFLCTGVVLTQLFLEHRGSIGRLYAADLVGAALGTCLLVPVMEWLGGPGGVIACGVITAAAAALLPGGGSWLRALGAGSLLVLLAAQQSWTLFSIDVDLGAGESPGEVVCEKWNAFSRVALLEDRGWERGLSAARWDAWDGRLPRQYEALIDINAYAPIVCFDGDLEKVRYLGELISNVVHHLRPTRQRVAILGPGGGKDVLGALLFDPERVVGIEINPILVEDLVRGVLREQAGGIYDREGVDIRVGDGRAVLASLEERFDAIVANSVATWSSHASGAMSLTEHSLFTLEACRLYHDRLTGDGMLSISLWDGPEYPLAKRWLATCDEVGRERGLPELASRAAVLGNLWGERVYATVIVGMSPLAPWQQDRLSQLARTLGFESLHIPGMSASEGDDPARVTEFLRDPAEGVRDSRFDIRPATDDRPFFLYTLRWQEALQFWQRHPGDENLAYRSLVGCLVIVTLLVAGMILLPLLFAGRSGGSPLGGRELLYFLALGAGFMLVEIPLMQRCTILLGHPTYALTVVLFGLLLWSGLGSAWAQTWSKTDGAARRLRRVMAAVVVVVVGCWLLLTPAITSAVRAGGAAAGIATTLAMLLPLGLPMGCGMPVGLEVVGARSPRALAWAWGVAGIAGVIASVLALMVSLFAGFGVTLALGAGCYALAACTAPKSGPQASLS